LFNAKIFFLDLYSETLPNDAPPSYKGHLVKYAYKITVGMQRLNSPIKLLRVPIRVVVIHGKFYKINKYLFVIYSLICLCLCLRTY
jgi:hypothetical protein